jgi:hypothetical protein
MGHTLDIAVGRTRKAIEGTDFGLSAETPRPLRDCYHAPPRAWDLITRQQRSYVSAAHPAAALDDEPTQGECPGAYG